MESGGGGSKAKRKIGKETRMGLYTVDIILSDSGIDGERQDFRGDATLSWRRLTGLGNLRFFSWRASGLEARRVQSRRSRDMCHVVESDPFRVRVPSLQRVPIPYTMCFEV